jgi:hypothetical protein
MKSEKPRQMRIAVGASNHAVSGTTTRAPGHARPSVVKSLCRSNFVVATGGRQVVLKQKSDQIASSLRAERSNLGPNALKLDCFVVRSGLLAMPARAQGMIALTNDSSV